MLRLKTDRFSMRGQVGLPASDNSGSHQRQVWILFNIRPAQLDFFFD